eukprot:4375069-Alexandrium_andersonii.AAC.1
MAEADIHRLQRAGRILLITYAYLTTEFLARRQMLFPLKPKLHQFDHLLEDLADDCLSPAKYAVVAKFGGRPLRVLRCAGSQACASTGSNYRLEPVLVQACEPAQLRTQSGRPQICVTGGTGPSPTNR